MNDKISEISICVGIKNKSFELFEYLISSMKECIDKDRLSLSIFDCGSNDINNLKIEIEKNWTGKLYFCSEDLTFTRSYSFNRAVKQSNANYVFLCDVDMTLPINFIKLFEDNVSNSSVWFPICFSLARGKERKIDVNNGWWRDSGFGMVGIKKSLYIEMNGLNEEFIKWGGEDNDFYNRTKVLKNRNKCIGLFHNWHFSENNYRTTPKKFRYLLEDNKFLKKYGFIDNKKLYFDK